jgi:hypothetical protein
MLISEFPFRIIVMYKKGFKRKMPRDFRLQVFFMNQFLPSPCIRYPISAASNFFVDTVKLQNYRTTFRWALKAHLLEELAE